MTIHDTKTCNCDMCRWAERNSTGETPMEDYNKRRYENRTARLLRLFELNAPKQIIARECLLVAGAVYDVPDLIDRVEDLVMAPDQKLVDDRKELDSYYKEHGS